MAEKIRVGLVGASVARGSWGTRAHVPALQALPDYQIKAIATAHQDTAEAAAKAYGADLAFDNSDAMAQHPDVEVVSVAVKVPAHHALVMGALNAGKHVYCEWPLGANLREAEEMAALAHEKGVQNVVGLQGRGDPTFNYLRELISGGYVGDVLACNMTLILPGILARPSDRAWQADRKMGANTMTINGGHAIDALCMVAGEFGEVSAKVGTQVKQWRLTDTAGQVDVDAPDNMLVSGVLENGALASVHVAGVPHHGSGWRLEIYGRDGAIFASANGMMQMTEPRVLAAKSGEQLGEISVPDRFTLVPEGTPKGSPFNVGQLYVRLAEAIRGEDQVEANFDLAVKRHRLLDAIERSSSEGRSIVVS